MKYADFAGDLGRRIGSYFAAEETQERIAVGLSALEAGYQGGAVADKALPAGWGTSPRRAPTAASYKPAHVRGLDKEQT